MDLAIISIALVEKRTFRDYLKISTVIFVKQPFIYEVL